MSRLRFKIVKKPWYKKWWGISITVFIMIVFYSGIIASSEDEKKITKPASEETRSENKDQESTDKKPTGTKPDETTQEIASKQWVEVKTFIGTGNLATENFDITSNDWRITASGSSSLPDMASISAYVFKNGKNPEDDSSDADFAIEGNGPETSYMRIGTGTYFLEIGSANTSWTIKVEEKR